MSKIVFTGGGTLGHVMPNIYLMEDLKKDNQIYYIGANSIEKDIMKKNNISFYEIPATKFNRGKIYKNFSVPFKLIVAIHKAKKILKDIAPDLIVSKGGYVALPVCIAARKLRIPIISHESDYSFGLANKIILRISNIMCVNFERLATKPHIIYTGPIISNNFKLSNIKSNVSLNLNSDKPTILIIGGSLGSKIINETIISVLPLLITKYNIIHIVGKGNLVKTKCENYNQFEMCDNMPYLYSISDLVVGRAGAGVVFESAYMQKPMLLIPLENKHSRGDQVQNAEYFQKKGCARIIYEAQLNSITITKNIELAFKYKDSMINALKRLDLGNGKEKMLKLIKNQIASNN